MLRYAGENVNSFRNVNHLKNLRAISKKGQLKNPPRLPVGRLHTPPFQEGPVLLESALFLSHIPPFILKDAQETEACCLRPQYSFSQGDRNKIEPFPPPQPLLGLTLLLVQQ